MGCLPAERISISRLLTTTGLDFAGPFDIKSFSGRVSRTVCVKARFPSQIISDNGRNYVGAAKAIAQDFLAVINEWRLGRIENVLVGKDSLALVADVRTDRGIIRRPIVKLVILPTN